MRRTATEPAVRRQNRGGGGPADMLEGEWTGGIAGSEAGSSGLMDLNLKRRFECLAWFRAPAKAQRSSGLGCPRLTHISCSRTRGLGLRAQSLGLLGYATRVSIQDSELRVQGSGLRVQGLGSGFCVLGSGPRVADAQGGSGALRPECCRVWRAKGHFRGGFGDPGVGSGGGDGVSRLRPEC